MKRFMALALSLALAGCNSTGQSDFAQFYQAVRQGVSASFGNARVTKDQAAAIPYASLGYRVNDGAEQLLVLATDANAEQLWTSNAHIVIVTRGGRIARTVGLTPDVSAVTPRGGLQIPAVAAALNEPTSYTRQEDFPDIPAYGAAISCSSVSKGRQTIVILGRGISTARIDETCRSAELKWSFTDSYWLDPDSGLVWRSIQHIHPKGEKIEVEIFRPPS